MPSCTSGIASLLPGPIPRLHTRRSCFTLPGVICLSGLCCHAEWLPRHMSQLPGSGLRSMASVTGLIETAPCARGAAPGGPGGCSAASAAPPIAAMIAAVSAVLVRTNLDTCIVFTLNSAFV
jgi:hypothetical protein